LKEIDKQRWRYLRMKKKMCIKGEVEVGKREIVCLYLNDKFMMILCSGDGD